MHNKSYHLCRLYFTLLGLVTLIFLFLYFDFISGKYLYAYQDTGLDTVATYLPRFIFEMDSIVNHSGSTYSLQWGLGSFITNYLLKYLNPVNLPLLLFGENMIHWGLLVSTYLKYALIALFSLLFFRCIIKDDRLAAGCALLWTFSGYAILWGQHYQFLTNILCFTICIYLFQLYLDGDKKSIFLIPALAFFIYNSYFHFYMSCYFFAGYGLFYLIINHSDFKKILKLVGIFVICVIWGILIAGDSILPSIVQFFSSTRMNDVTGSAGTPLIYPIKYLLTFLSRLLSNNMIGIGDDFSGTTNYYEAAILSVSVLFLFMLVFLLQGKHKIRVAIITICCVVALCFTPVSHILGFSFDNQRWTFIYCFLEVIVIGIGLHQYFTVFRKPESQKLIVRTVLVTDAIYAFFVLLLWVAQCYSAIDIKFNNCLILAFFMAVYSALLIILPCWKIKYSYIPLAVIFCLELVVSNYSTINHRTKVTTDQWYHEMYYDESKDLVSMIQSQDPTLYRINKTFDSVHYNDSMVQHYNGVGVYSSVNSAELVNLAKTLNFSSDDNHVRFSANNDIINTLLGVKYLIASPDTPVNDQYYEEIYSDGTYIVYENKLHLGFGYLYTSQISKEFFDSCSNAERSVLLTDHYYLSSEQSSSSNFQLPDMSIIDEIDLFDYFIESINCNTASSEDNLLVQAQDSSDMQLYFEMPKIPQGWKAYDLTITFTATESSNMQLFFAGEDGIFTEEQSALLHYHEGPHTMTISSEALDSCTALRLDPSTVAQDIEIESIELTLVNEQYTAEQLQQLQENTMTDFTQDGNTFTGTISNPNEEAMLCIPMIYSSHWSATVDGETAQVHNINGGLIGISLSEGHHEISITYQDNTQQIGFAIGVVSFLIYVIFSIIWWRRQQRHSDS